MTHRVPTGPTTAGDLRIAAEPVPLRVRVAAGLCRVGWPATHH
ncbi:hypothetical protein ACQP1S_17480 [Micromonospora matsumotoense]